MIITIEEKRKKLDSFCRKKLSCTECPLNISELRCGMGFCFYSPKDKDGEVTDAEVELAHSVAFPDAEEKSGLQEAVEKIQACGIKDSGTRREFDTGAVRDIQEGKGRCDLMPLDVVAGLYKRTMKPGSIPYWTFTRIDQFKSSGEVKDLYDLLDIVQIYPSTETMFLEVSKHFEEGAKKYGEHNWQKGIPVKCYIDSAVRHYLKWLRGDTDEPHDRAFVWNIMCCIWTCIHKPELNDYRKEGKLS